MQTNDPLRRLARGSLALLALSHLVVRAPAQAVNAPDATAAELARYDRNRDGRLDPAELATKQADEARAARVGTSAATPTAANEPAVQLSPFEVKEDNTGYYATNTMSGTRMNTKLEDLASSISVVTKQQMTDFAMIDLNDIFAHEANTEGTGNFTSFSVDRNGMVTDEIQDNPQGANRVRGIGRANIAVDNFATSGRVPVDPINIDSVEISRGPNSNIFGLGEGSGTVNLVAATANLNRASNTASVRVDDLGGWRTSIDLNRPIIPGKLALRGSAVYQRDEFPQQPSGFDTRRYNIMLRAQPFKYTTIRGSFQAYRGEGTRATAITPRDGVSWWRAVGSPTWDPPTGMLNWNGQRFPVGTGNAQVLGAGSFGARPTIFVTDGGISLWTVQRTPAATATNGPNNTSGPIRLMETIPEPIRTGRPLFSTVPGINDISLFNWEDINLAAPNRIEDKVDTSTVSIEQSVLDNHRHKLAFQFAWQREDADRTNRNVIGQASSTGASYYLYVDPNERLLDGRPNPNFLRPYIGVGEPVTEERPEVRDSYRLQGAYGLDFTTSDGWKRWLGRHSFLGYYEERKTKSYRYRYRDVMISDNPIYAPAGQPKGNQSGQAAPVATRPYYRFYVGDNLGQNVDHAPNSYGLGDYTFNWFDPRANRWVGDRVTLGRAGINEGTAGNFAVLNLIKTRGGIMQNSLFDDRLVLTAGLREDENRNKSQRPSVLKSNGWEFDYAAMDGWVGDWALRSGETETRGLVARPFRNWSAINRARERGGVTGFAAQVLSGLQFHYNESDSFRPEPPAITILTTELPNPTSEQKEKGFTLNLWNNKLVLRANWYETGQINSRAGQSAIFATRTGRVDFAPFKGENDAIALQRQARNWVMELNPGFTDVQRDAEVARIMQLPGDYLAAINNNVVTETSDVIGEGEEYELHFNPSSYWTLRLNATRQEARDANLSPNIPAWIAQRLPVWETIIDPRTGVKWLDQRYSGDNPVETGGSIPRTFLQNNVLTPLALARATEGKARPQTREWRFNLGTRYRLAGLTSHRHFARMSVGGALRWESEGAIGYYGIPVNGDITIATAFDPNRPIYDSAHLYADAFASYSTRLFSDRVRATFQLNVRNLQESGRLQKVGAYPDGRAHTFRIINPRTFIFTATFDL